MACSHGMGLAAYMHVNYTTAMLFSTIRLPSVLLVGGLVSSFQRRGSPTPCRAYSASMVAAAGLAIFGLAERREAPRFSTRGLLLVAGNQALGAVTFNFQQRILQKSRVSGPDPEDPDAKVRLGDDVTEQLMLVQYATAALLMLIYSAAVGELPAFEAWCRSNRRSVWLELLPLMAGASLTSVGVRALLKITQEFDAARSAVVTNSRKVCTFALSFLFFDKVFSSLHFVGLMLTICGSMAVHRSLEKIKMSS